MEEEATRAPAVEHVRGLGGAVLDDDAIRELLQKLTLLANHIVREAAAVSITVVDDGQYRTTNSTGRGALAMDDAQYRADDGPCLRAIGSARQLQMVVGDGDGGAPYDEEAQRAGIGRVLSTPLLREGGGAVGAVNIYAREGGEFSDDEARAARLIADNAAILVRYAFALADSSQLNEQLRNAVASREIIGAAKGILMESQSCTRDEAFDILRRASQRENRKLRDLAEELVLRVEARAASKKGR